MKATINFLRMIFVFLCMFLVSTYTYSLNPYGFDLWYILLGTAGGLVLGVALVAIEKLFSKNISLKTFNIAALGLLFGSLLGFGFITLFNHTLGVLLNPISAELITGIKIGIILVAAYLGMLMTLQSSEEIYLSIPFIQLKTTKSKNKDFIIDSSILYDPRILDFLATGIVDKQLVVPRFILKEIYRDVELGDENEKKRARKLLEVLKKLEELPELNLRYEDKDYPEISDQSTKLLQLARDLGSNLLISDLNRIQQSLIKGVKIVTLNNLSNALKPITQTGEFLDIKVQRYGKEARQGVGYLDDGTMVVVNGGAEYIGESIKAQVLSVKHTSSGRMIFCNALEENILHDPRAHEKTSTPEHHQRNYFPL